MVDLQAFFQYRFTLVFATIFYMVITSLGAYGLFAVNSNWYSKYILFTFYAKTAWCQSFGIN